MSCLDICANAEDDLGQLWDDDPRAAAAVAVALDEMNKDPNLHQTLTTYGEVEFGEQRIFIKKWVGAQRAKKGIWRFRVLDTPATGYRVVYGYHWQARQIWVLAIAKKEKLDYDHLDSDLGQRIFSDWFEITGGEDT